MSLGNRLKIARKAAGFTQKSLAESVGISPSAVANYETGVSAPNEDILIHLMNLLNIDANYLYADDLISRSDVFYLSPDEARIISIYRSLNSAGQQMVLTTLESFDKNPALSEETQIGVS